MLIMMRIIKYLLFIIIAFGLFCNSIAEETGVKLTPRQTVIKWTQVYGVDMDRASDLTTLVYREGMTKKDWIARYAPTLESIGYKHMGGDIVAELTEDSKSMIVMHSKIMTVAGGIEQVEIYELLNSDGTWLINNITVKEKS